MRQICGEFFLVKAKYWLEMRAKESFNCHQFFSTNQEHVKNKLMQNETNL